MTAKEFMDKYFTHETILKKAEFDKQHSTINFKIEYCEWQLDELSKTKNQYKGYEIVFYNVKNISNEDIFRLHDEFILELKIDKTKIYIGLDTNEYLDLSFSYKDFKVKDCL